jgi:WS/DGAT/MGAT family acyltransferase
VGKLFRPARKVFRAERRLGGMLARQCREIRADPGRVASLAQVPVRGTAALARLLFLWPDRKTLYKGELGVPKRAAWSAAIPLQDVKATGKGLGGTINDVLLTAMSGALRRYLQDRGTEVEGLDFRAIVPVNLRRPGTEEDLGNKFGLVFLPLPIGIADPNARLRELKRRMDALKDSLEAPVAFGILTSIGIAPEPIQDLVVTIFGMKGTAVMTNVIGPKETVYLAGAPLEAMMFWVPQSGRLGLGVSILSYAGRVWMGVITDEGLVPDPDAIIAAFQDEFDELLELACREKESTSPEEPAAEPEETSQVPAPSPDAIGEDSPETTDYPERCQALTKAGARCKNRALDGSRFCRVHQRSKDSTQ